MSIVRVQLKMLAHRKEAAGIECGFAPLRVFALVKELRTRVRRWVITANREPFFDLNAVAIAPRNLAAVWSSEVGTVLVGEQKPHRGKVKREGGFHAVDRRRVRRWKVAIPDGKHQRPGFGFVQIEEGYVL